MKLLISTIVGSLLAYVATEMFDLSDIAGFLIAGALTAAVQVYFILNDGK